jgi:hypothetical protein
MVTVNDCRIIRLPRISSKEGNLTPVYGNKHIPFEIKRVYYVYDIPGGESRGGHAHKDSLEFIVSLMGSFDVLINDGTRQKTVTLNRAYFGLYVPNLIWRELFNFSSGAICFVITSSLFSEGDYIRDYNDFVKQIKHGE